MLWVVVLCFVSAFAIALLAPLILAIGRKQLLHPRTALLLWFGAFFAGICLILFGLLVSLFSAVFETREVGTTESILLTSVGWLGLGVFGALCAYIAVSAEPLVAHQSQTINSLARAQTGRETRVGFTLVKFASAEPISFAVPGRRPEIFVSSAMETLLTKTQIDAVLAHEYAHLRYRHGWAVRIAQINALVFVRLRAGDALLRATHLLIELAADDVAARQAGAANLGNALHILANQRGDAGMLLRAERLTNKLWPRASRRKLPKSISRVAEVGARPSPHWPGG